MYEITFERLEPSVSFRCCDHIAWNTSEITSDFAFLGMLRNGRAAASAIIITMCDAIYAERGYATVRRLSVCLSVCDFQVL